MVSRLQVDDDTLQDLQNRLLNSNGNIPLHDRFRALFTLKAVGDERAVEVISKGESRQGCFILCSVVNAFELGFTDSSALLKHELAYVLGQINNPAAVPTLNSVLENKEEDPMVRHEVS